MERTQAKIPLKGYHADLYGSSSRLLPWRAYARRKRIWTPPIPAQLMKPVTAERAWNQTKAWSALSKFFLVYFFFFFFFVEALITYKWKQTHKQNLQQKKIRQTNREHRAYWHGPWKQVHFHHEQDPKVYEKWYTRKNWQQTKHYEMDQNLIQHYICIHFLPRENNSVNDVSTYFDTSSFKNQSERSGTSTTVRITQTFISIGKTHTK